ncbi:hypothetical protein ACFE04_013282 [Oxalis oulophora]
MELANADYAEACSKSILFFEGQRSGKLPPSQRVTWRGDSALSDGKPDNVDLSGGYYDAGDNVKFGWTTSFTVCLLSWGAIEYEKGFTSLFDFADKYRASYSASCPFYCSYSGYQDELLWAAAWLHKATKDSSYLNYVLSNKGWSQQVNEFSWDNKFAGMQMLLAKEFSTGEKQLSQFKTNIDSFVCALMPGSSSKQIKTTNGGLLFIRDSSNLQYATSATMLLFMHSNTFAGVQCGSTHFSASQVRAFAKSQVDYILGKNPKNMSYMVGYGSKYPTRLHHRGASIPSIKVHPAKVGCNDGYSNYYNSPNANPNVHVGAIVGGPDGNDQFSDSRSDYSHSEPTTYMNAAFVSSIAALLSTSTIEQGSIYLSHMNQTVDSNIYL